MFATIVPIGSSGKVFDPMGGLGGGGAPAPGQDDPNYCMDSVNVEQWDSSKQNYCCQNMGMGCPENGPIEPLAGIGKLMTALQGCSTGCAYDGHVATCSERIFWASTHRFASDPNKCQSSLQATVGVCKFCLVCALEASGCAP